MQIANYWRSIIGVVLKLDLSCMESRLVLAGSDLQFTFDAPLLVLYSKMQVEGKLRALLIVSLWTSLERIAIVGYARGLLDFIPDLGVCLVTIPDADYILVRSYANGATTYPRPLIWFFISRWLKIVKLFSKNGEDDVFPEAV
jgi:hypothetical protein